MSSRQRGHCMLMWSGIANKASLLGFDWIRLESSILDSRSCALLFAAEGVMLSSTPVIFGRAGFGCDMSHATAVSGAAAAARSPTVTNPESTGPEAVLPLAVRLDGFGDRSVETSRPVPESFAVGLGVEIESAGQGPAGCRQILSGLFAPEARGSGAPGAQTDPNDRVRYRARRNSPLRGCGFVLGGLASTDPAPRQPRPGCWPSIGCANNCGGWGLRAPPVTTRTGKVGQRWVSLNDNDFNGHNESIRIPADRIRRWLT